MEHAVSQPEQPSEMMARLGAYWRALGLTDPVLIEGLSQDCLNRARRLIVRVDEDAVLRRAIEEAHRRFDLALSAAMSLPPSNEPQPLAAARAALLQSKENADTLFRHDETTRQLKERLESILPTATPPESRLSMKPVAIDFWFFKS